MKKYFYYNEAGEVKFRSDVKQDTSLPYIYVTADEEKLKQNWIPKVDKGKLLLEKPPHIEEEEKKAKIDSIKAKIESVTDVGIKSILTDILNLK